VLLAVLVVILLGSRTELLLTYGLAGEAGQFAAETCGRDLQYDGTTTRAQCLGTFTADDGTSYRSELYYDGHPGDSYAVQADPGSGTAYRTDVWSRWSSIALPLVPAALLWLLLGGWWAFRQPGVLSRGHRLVFLGVFGVPAAGLLLAAVVGFLAAVATS
jgi:hypothetical protein